jgi:hypothetical protein
MPAKAAVTGNRLTSMSRMAKRVDSRYEPGQRSGAWQKMPVYQGQGFVIGGSRRRDGPSQPVPCPRRQSAMRM